METLWRLIDWMREPWLTQVRDSWVRIDPRYQRVRVYRGSMLMTNRPTLKQCMDRIRKYCPMKTRIL